MSAGLGTVPAQQTYLDVGQGNRIFDSLYDTELPARGMGRAAARMVHERIGHWVEAHSAIGPAHGLTNSAPGMIFCLPAAIAFTVYAAWSTRPYWQGRPGVIAKCVFGTALLLFSAGGMEILVNLVKTHQTVVSLETLLEESGEMIGTTIVLWGVIELLAAEKLAVHFDAKGIHFGKSEA